MKESKRSFVWMQNVQSWLFALLAVNALFLALVVATPHLNWNTPFAQEQRLVLDTALAVQHQGGQLFGNLQLETEDGLSLGAARLYRNGIFVGDFGASSLLTRVYEGDQLLIDAQAYQRQLVFHLTSASANIDTRELPPRIITNGDAVELPLIRFR